MSEVPAAGSILEPPKGEGGTTRTKLHVVSSLMKSIGHPS